MQFFRLLKDSPKIKRVRVDVPEITEELFTQIMLENSTQSVMTDVLEFTVDIVRS